MQQTLALLLVLTCTILSLSSAFVTPLSSVVLSRHSTTPKVNNHVVTSLFALDPVTYIRTEWVSAALCTNQTPTSADRVLQMGSEDGRVVNFVPRTVREIITSSAERPDGPEGGGLTVSCERQLKQMAEGRKSAKITYSNQPADNLKDTPSLSVDIVISFQAAQRMHENGLDWKKSIYEAGRVLKPGGRLLFVEAAEVGGESYLDYVTGLSEFRAGGRGEGYEEASSATERDYEDGESKEEEDGKASPIFEEVGYDQVDMVLQPHIAGVAIKALDANLTPVEKAQKAGEEERDRLADLSINAFERGNKSRRKRKKKKKKPDSNISTP